MVALVFLAAVVVALFQGCGTCGSHYMTYKGCQARKIGNHVW
jgi:uncharacterized protein YceK